jgi:DNA-binding FadR family transcriptional regulator
MTLSLTASVNPFVPALMDQLGQLLYTLRRETSAFIEVQEHANVHHTAVRAAVASRNPDEACRAMEEVPVSRDEPCGCPAAHAGR